MEQEIARILPYLLGGMFLVGVLSLLVALQQLRVRRKGSYWLMRRRAGERGGRLFLLGVGLMIASLALTVVSGLAAVAFRNVSGLITRNADGLYGIVLSPTSAGSVTEALVMADTTATAVILATNAPPTDPPPTLVPTLAPTQPSPEAQSEPTAALVPPSETPLPPQPTSEPPTGTASPTSAIFVELTPAFNATPRPPNTNYNLTLTAADTTVNPNGSPLSPRRNFEVDVKRLYFFIAYSNMENGVAWSRVLYRDGDPVQGNTLLWSLGADGNSYFFFGDEAGYAPGNYEVRLFVGDQEASSLRFTVAGG